MVASRGKARTASGTHGSINVAYRSAKVPVMTASLVSKNYDCVQPRVQKHP